IAEAALHTPNLVVAGAAAVGAVALHSLPVIALGGAAYGAMVAWDLVSPEFWKKKLAGPAAVAPSKLPDPKALKSKALVEALQAVVRARATLQQILDATP